LVLAILTVTLLGDPLVYYFVLGAIVGIAVSSLCVTASTLGGTATNADSIHV
jgi:hypothetical protein